ncbi:uncharacterized protein TNIN_45261 [Trichonephila inaurata madagascariensis]|uniref:CCHC-type domain-containing protein n=1 Tax=Trichonephila inaurata madagascariensis TaxID=2747483 RepID=A0A8X6X1B1_9ARAC|nr:uncharacterized protein TNIN_45261 [Trichonephila inaurata madagascariensis]
MKSIVMGESYWLSPIKEGWIYLYPNMVNSVSQPTRPFYLNQNSYLAADFNLGIACFRVLNIFPGCTSNGTYYNIIIRASETVDTYDEKTNWEVYKTQFSIISEANGWTEGVKAYQLAAFLRGEAAEVLQTLPDTKRLNLNSLYNALDLRFGQKYSKDYAHLQMKTRLQKTGESLQEWGNSEGAIRMADVTDLKSALLYALKLEAATQASRRDRHSIRGARVTADESCESRLLKEMEKLKEEMQTIKAGISKQEKRNFKCWGCGGTGHLRRNCPRARKKETTVSSTKQENQYMAISWGGVAR